MSDQLSSLTSGGLYNSGGSGAVQGAYIWPRDLDMNHWLNEDGSKYRLFESELVQNDFDNPYWILNKMPHTNNTKRMRSEEHTSELQSRGHLVCRLLLEKKKKNRNPTATR